MILIEQKGNALNYLQLSCNSVEYASVNTNTFDRCVRVCKVACGTSLTLCRLPTQTSDEHFAEWEKHKQKVT